MPPENLMKVLVADDSPVYRKLVQHALIENHCSLIFAQSGREALDLFANHRPNLVIVDWVMPDLTGIEICRQIRSESKESYTYIIIVTGMAEKENVAAGLAAAFTSFLQPIPG